MSRTTPLCFQWTVPKVNGHTQYPKFGKQQKFCLCLRSNEVSWADCADPLKHRNIWNYPHHMYTFCLLTFHQYLIRFSHISSLKSWNQWQLMMTFWLIEHSMLRQATVNHPPFALIGACPRGVSFLHYYRYCTPMTVWAKPLNVLLSSLPTTLP